MEISAKFHEKLLQICPDGVIGNDMKGNILFFNPGAERLLGYTREEVVRTINVAAVYPPGGAREVKEFLYSEEFGGRGRLVDFETEVVRKDGRRIPIRLSCALILEGSREVGFIGFFSDISARKTAERQSLEAAKRFRSIVETAGDGIVSFDAERRIATANRAAEEVLGYGRGELIGSAFRQLIPSKYGDSWEEIERYAASGSASAAGRSVELTLLSKSGREVEVEISISKKESGRENIRTAVIRDISERKAMEHELRVLAITDTLTQLYNRRHFHSLAEKELDRARRTKVVFSLLLVDIDHFKRYNDTYGHAEGDRVLMEMGELLRKNFRTMDSCFRMGGEEFLVLLPEARADGAAIAAERLRARFSDAVFRPRTGEDAVRMTVSIGIAEHHEGDTIEDMIRFADLAMYAAKNGGRNRWVSYETFRGRMAGAGGASEFPA